jgi:hypothetical protein
VAPDFTTILLIWTFLACGCLVFGWRRGWSSFTVLGVSALSGSVGAIVGLVIGLYLDGTFLGTGSVVTAWSAMGATLGWIIGAMIGLCPTRRALSVRRSEGWVLGVSGALLLLIAVLVAHSVIVPSFFQVDGQIYNPSAVAFTRRLVLLDGALAAGICLGLALRNRRRRASSDIAAIM